MFGKECGGEVTQVSQQRILLVAPVGSKLKRVAISLMLSLATFRFLFFGVSCGIGIILCLIIPVCIKPYIILTKPITKIEPKITFLYLGFFILIAKSAKL